MPTKYTYGTMNADLLYGCGKSHASRRNQHDLSLCHYFIKNDDRRPQTFPENRRLLHTTTYVFG